MPLLYLTSLLMSPGCGGDDVEYLTAKETARKRRIIHERLKKEADGSAEGVASKHRRELQKFDDRTEWLLQKRRDGQSEADERIREIWVQYRVEMNRLRDQYGKASYKLEKAVGSIEFKYINLDDVTVRNIVESDDAVRDIAATLTDERRIIFQDFVRQVRAAASQREEKTQQRRAEIKATRAEERARIVRRHPAQIEEIKKEAKRWVEDSEKELAAEVAAAEAMEPRPKGPRVVSDAEIEKIHDFISRDRMAAEYHLSRMVENDEIAHLTYKLPNILANTLECEEALNLLRSDRVPRFVYWQYLNPGLNDRESNSPVSVEVWCNHGDAYGWGQFITTELDQSARQE